MPDAARPRLHFTPRRGWINDPLALTWHDGRYHLFFQYVPGRTEWDTGCHWGHAVGHDLVRWQEEQPALAPGDGDDGVWSGGLVVDDAGAATILYTSVAQPDTDLGRVRLATPLDDSWLTWRKGPVVLEPPEAPAVRFFRDPFVFREHDRWRMLVGTALEGDTAAVLAYASDDLQAWTAEGVALERSGGDRDPIWTGSGWECPQLLEVDGVHVLVLSVWAPGAIHHVVAAVGDWADGRFTPRAWQALTDGPGYYAPSVFRDRTGRPCIVFWIRGAGGAEEGWAGAVSVPHVLSVKDDVLVLTPHPDAVASSATAGVGAVAEVEAAGPTLIRGRADADTDLHVVGEGLGEVAVRADGDDLVLHVGGAGYARFPRDGDRLEVLVDGPVVELWQGPTVYAAVRTPLATA